MPISTYMVTYEVFFALRAPYILFFEEDQKKINQPGFDSGLDLEFYSGQPTNELSNHNHGMALYITDFGILPGLLDLMTVEPGSMTDIVLRKSEFKRIPQPYSDCIDINSYESILYEELRKANKSYRYSECMLLCYQLHSVEACGCYDLYFAPALHAQPCKNSY